MATRGNQAVVLWWVVCAGLGAPCAGGARAQDDWSLTRPRRPAGASQPAKARARTTAPARDGARDERQRYLELALADPRSDFALQRLIALFGAHDAGGDPLVDELLARHAASPAQVPPLLLLARVYAERSDLAAARQRFEQAAALAPSVEPLLLWAQLERAQADLARARALLEQALPRARTKPARGEVLEQLAACALAQGEHDVARGHFEARAALFRGSVAHALAYARALTASAQDAAAAREYARVLGSFTGDGRLLPPLWLEVARAEHAASRRDAALAWLARIRGSVWSDAGLRAQAAELRLAWHAEAGTLPALAHELSRSARRDASSLVLLGRVHEALGSAAPALAAYEQALRADPGLREARDRVIALLSREGRMDEVLAHQRELVAREPSDLRAFTTLCELLRQSGQPDAALALATSAERRRRSDVALHVALSALYTRWNEGEALQRVQRRLSVIDRGDPTHLIALGEAELAAGRSDAARALFDKTLAAGGRTARAHERLGQLYLDRDMGAEALREYDAALAQSPDDLSSLRGRAEALELLGRAAEAEAQWRAVYELVQGDEGARAEVRARLLRVWKLLSALPRHVAEHEEAFAYQGGQPREVAPGQALDADAGRFLAEEYELLARSASRFGKDTRYAAAAEGVRVRLSQIAPNDVANLVALERMRARRGDSEGALSVLARLLHADPAGVQGYLTRMAEHALALYRDAEALSYARRAAALAPDDAAAQERLGDHYVAQRDPPAALLAYRRALELEPGRFALCMRVAELERSLGRASPADELLHRIVRGSGDEELVARAARMLLQSDASSAALLRLEQALTPLAWSASSRGVYRRTLLAVYAGLAARATTADERAAVARRAQRVLLSALAERDPSQAGEAVELALQLGTPAIARPLLVLAEGAAPLSLRVRALTALGAFAEPSDLSRLLALAQAKEPLLRATAAYVVARVPGTSAAAALRALVASEAPMVRALALLALAQRKALGVEDALRSALFTDRSVVVRGYAAVGLALAGDGAATDWLSDALRTQRGELGALAALSLGLRADPAAAPALASACFADDALKRDAAWLALRALGAPPQAPPQLPRPTEPASLGTLSPLLRAALSGATVPDLTLLDPLRVSAAVALAGNDAQQLVVLERLTPGRTPAAPPAGFSAELARELLGALVPALGGLTSSPSVAVRTRLPALLVHAPRLGAPALERLLHDGDPRVRDSTLAALADGPGPHDPLLAPSLIELARAERSFVVRSRAVRALARLDTGGVTAALAHTLAHDGYALVRELAVAALAGRGSAGARVALERAARADDEPRVRAAAARAVSALPGVAPGPRN